MMELINELLTDDRVVREVVNGIWFILGLEIIFFLSLYLLRAYCDHNHPIPWLKRLPVQMAIAWTIYMVGSSIRSGWVWTLLECQNRTMTACLYIQENFELLFIAGVCAIIGGMFTIQCITKHWGTWPWIVSALIATVIPVLIHIYV